MELKLKKRINNRRLPKYAGGADYGSAISATAGAVGSIYLAHLFDTFADDYINKYGSSTQHYGDVGYTALNDINKSAEEAIVSKQNKTNTINTTLSGATAGAAIGSIIPGVGTLIGGAVGALGGFIGGLFGGKSRKRKARELLRQAQMRVDNYNDMARADAATTALSQDQAELLGDTRALTLLSYSRGKDDVDPATGETINNHIVETADGPEVGKQNSWVSEGEGVWNPSKGTANFIKHGPNDTARANLNEDDVVFGSAYNPTTGNTFKEDAAPYILAQEKLNKLEPKGEGWLAEQTKKTWDLAKKPLQDEIDNNLSNLANILKQVHEDEYTEGLMKARCGKNAGSLPGFDDGYDFSQLKELEGLPWETPVLAVPTTLSAPTGYNPDAIRRDILLDTSLQKQAQNGKKTKSGARDPYAGLNWSLNAVPAAIGAISSFGQYAEAKNDTPYKPYSFLKNQMLTRGLRTLAERRINPYGIIQQLRDAEARGYATVAMSGGLNTALKQLGRLSSINATQQNIAKNLYAIQETNNGYAKDLGDAQLRYGSDEADRRQKAYQYDTDYYAKSHAARQQGMQMGLFNFNNQIQQYAANEFKRRQAIAMLDRYDQLLSDDQRKYVLSLMNGKR